MEAMAQTPASWPSLVDQLLREGIELRDRGDTTNAIERLQEALDNEPNNAAVLAELAKTYDLTQLYDRANEMWRKLPRSRRRMYSSVSSPLPLAKSLFFPMILKPQFSAAL